jgi:multimeric flavodoxin WrbA
MGQMVKQTEILFICGSPRSHTSEELLGLVEQGVRDAGARTQQFLLSQKHIAPCIGCGACSRTGVCVLANKIKDGKLLDDYLELTAALGRVDALALVAPLFFAGPPAQLKALLDRMQPFWAQRYVLGQKPAPKRPAQLFILGGGGDNHGYEPLVTIAKSALAVAGFTVEKVQSFVGFRASSDVTPVPSDEEAANMAFGELAHLRKLAAMQADFKERAYAAGGAFARFVRKSLEKLELQAELRQVEAEIAKLKASEDDAAASPRQPLATKDADELARRVVSRDAAEPAHRPTIADDDSLREHIELDFEALKQSAHAQEGRPHFDGRPQADRHSRKVAAVQAVKVARAAADRAAQDSTANTNADDAAAAPATPDNPDSAEKGKAGPDVEASQPDNPAETSAKDDPTSK